jgi:hypothetical protein
VSGGESPVADSIFITEYQRGCQGDVSSGLGMAGRARAVAMSGSVRQINPVAATNGKTLPTVA